MAYVKKKSWRHTDVLYTNWFSVSSLILHFWLAWYTLVGLFIDRLGEKALFGTTVQKHRWGFHGRKESRDTKEDYTLWHPNFGYYRWRIHFSWQIMLHNLIWILIHAIHRIDRSFPWWEMKLSLLLTFKQITKLLYNFDKRIRNCWQAWWKMSMVGLKSSFLE